MLRKSMIVLMTSGALLLLASPSYSWGFTSFFGTYTRTDGGGCREDEPGAPVPEPTAALLFGAGMVVAGAAKRRRARV